MIRLIINKGIINIMPKIDKLIIRIITVKQIKSVVMI